MGNPLEVDTAEQARQPGPADTVRQVLPDLLLADDPPIDVLATARVMWGQAAVVVSVAGSDRSFGFEFPVEVPWAETMVAVAERLQDALDDLLGSRRPACRAAGHDHPLTPTIDQDTAVWRCPKSAYQVEVTRYSGA
ncbi:MAG TPA: hypothetical protein VIS06_02080 [Mycobacteriales bacterium]